MSDNIFEQLVLKNNKLLLLSNSGSVSDQAKASKRISSKLDRNLQNIKSEVTEAVTYIAVKKNSIGEVESIGTVNEINLGSNESILNAQKYIDEVAERDNIAAAASRLEFKISKAIDEAYINSTAKDIYNFKKDPTAVINKANAEKVLEEEVERFATIINDVSQSNANSDNNKFEIKKLLS